MRIRLSLKVDKKENCLPLNYQYEISSWNCKVLHQGNSAFSQWLHSQGYTLGKKQFKLFTFAQIYIFPRWQNKGDRIEIYSQKAELEISFLLDEATSSLIMGLFQEESFTIGDKISRARFTIEKIEVLPQVSFSNQVEFRSISPICLSRNSETKDTPEYLSPSIKNYEDYFFRNLLHKYMLFSNEADMHTLKEKMETISPMQLQITNKPKSRLIKIKADTPHQTFIRGYVYNFSITAPSDLLELGYYTGFGEKNSLGFGCTRIVC